MCLEPTNTLESLKEPGRHPCSLHTGNSFQGHKYYFNTWFPAMPLSNTDPSTPCPCRGKGIYDGPPRKGGQQCFYLTLAPLCAGCQPVLPTAALPSVLCRRKILPQAANRHWVGRGAAQPRTPHPCWNAGAPRPPWGTACPQLTSFTSAHLLLKARQVYNGRQTFSKNSHHSSTANKSYPRK